MGIFNQLIPFSFTYCLMFEKLTYMQNNQSKKGENVVHNKVVILFAEL